jgi:hypothetical protein
MNTEITRRGLVRVAGASGGFGVLGAAGAGGQALAVRMRPCAAPGAICDIAVVPCVWPRRVRGFFLAVARVGRGLADCVARHREIESSSPSLQSAANS